MLHHVAVPQFASELTEGDRDARLADATRLADQFDAVVHLDLTRAIDPIERTAGWKAGEPPEIDPSEL